MNTQATHLIEEIGFAADYPVERFAHDAATAIKDYVSNAYNSGQSFEPAELLILSEAVALLTKKAEG